MNESLCISGLCDVHCAIETRNCETAVLEKMQQDHCKMVKEASLAYHTFQAICTWFG